MASPTAYACIFLLAVIVAITSAHDPDQLQDFCPSSDDPTNKLSMNGVLCKNPKDVTASDFHFKGLDVPLDTNNKFGINYIILNALNFSGVNTLGIAFGRVDLAADGVVPPHIHPRGTEVFMVMEGTIYVGFTTPENKLFTKVLNKGDVFVFPQGLVHFQHNVGKTPGYAINAFSSQNPGIYPIPPALFGTDPPIAVNTLAKAFLVDAAVIKELQSKSSSSS